MMLLGILLHTAIAYTGVPNQGYFRDGCGDPSLWLPVSLVIHLFRMPVFFFLSGFFSALLYARRGIGGLLQSRLQRVGLVWLAGLAALTPIVYWVNVYNHFATQGGPAWRRAWSAIASLRVQPGWLHDKAFHLWYLEYLLVFSLVTVLLLVALQKLPSRLVRILDRLAAGVFTSPIAVLVLAVPTAVIICGMPRGIVPYPRGFTPRADVLMMHGWFYAVGVLLYRCRQVLPAIARSCVWYIVAAAVLLAVNAYSILHVPVGTEGYELPTSHLSVTTLSAALGTWTVILGLLGLVVRTASRPRLWLAYMADACYWLYLTHFPVVMLLPATLAGWDAPTLLKVMVICSATIAFLLLIYDRFVRYTAIGTFLNGPRRRR